ncbi:hypothetical protein TYRP_015499 [Tyrophagus putrescentiae]|nr:hypothetical protein TYRP_015499 [Tyrophagus putrescentiae]
MDPPPPSLGVYGYMCPSMVSSGSASISRPISSRRMPPSSSSAASSISSLSSLWSAMACARARPVSLRRPFVLGGGGPGGGDPGHRPYLLLHPLPAVEVHQTGLAVVVLGADLQPLLLAHAKQRPKVVGAEEDELPFLLPLDLLVDVRQQQLRADPHEEGAGAQGHSLRRAFGRRQTGGQCLLAGRLLRRLLPPLLGDALQALHALNEAIDVGEQVPGVHSLREDVGQVVLLAAAARLRLRHAEVKVEPLLQLKGRLAVHAQVGVAEADSIAPLHLLPVLVFSVLALADAEVLSEVNLLGQYEAVVAARLVVARVEHRRAIDLPLDHRVEVGDHPPVLGGVVRGVVVPYSPSVAVHQVDVVAVGVDVPLNVRLQAEVLRANVAGPLVAPGSLAMIGLRLLETDQGAPELHQLLDARRGEHAVVLVEADVVDDRPRMKNLLRLWDVVHRLLPQWALTGLAHHRLRHRPQVDLKVVGAGGDEALVRAGKAAVLNGAAVVVVGAVKLHQRIGTAQVVEDGRLLAAQGENEAAFPIEADAHRPLRAHHRAGVEVEEAVQGAARVVHRHALLRVGRHEEVGRGGRVHDGVELIAGGEAGRLDGGRANVPQGDLIGGRGEDVVVGGVHGEAFGAKVENKRKEVKDLQNRTPKSSLTINGVPDVPEQQPPTVAARGEQTAIAAELHRVDAAKVPDQVLVVEAGGVLQPTVHQRPGPGGGGVRYGSAAGSLPCGNPIHDILRPGPRIDRPTKYSLIQWPVLLLVLSPSELVTVTGTIFNVIKRKGMESA